VVNASSGRRGAATAGGLDTRAVMSRKLGAGPGGSGPCRVRPPVSGEPVGPVVAVKAVTNRCSGGVFTVADR
jgi:hypothetical protein